MLVVPVAVVVGWTVLMPAGLVMWVRVCWPMMPVLMLRLVAVSGMVWCVPVGGPEPLPPTRGTRGASGFA